MVFFIGPGNARSKRADAVLRQVVDEVPPRAGDDHLLVHRERVERLERTRAAVAGQRDRAVALLAEARAAPQPEHERAPRRRVGERDVGEERLPDPPLLRRGDPVEVHLGLHVGLHRGRARGVGGAGQLGTDAPEQLVGLHGAHSSVAVERHRATARTSRRRRALRAGRSRSFSGDGTVRERHL
jgi:hypothetical protein